MCNLSYKIMWNNTLLTLGSSVPSIVLGTGVMWFGKQKSLPYLIESMLQHVYIQYIDCMQKITFFFPAVLSSGRGGGRGLEP